MQRQKYIFFFNQQKKDKKNVLLHLNYYTDAMLKKAIQPLSAHKKPTTFAVLMSLFFYIAGGQNAPDINLFEAHTHCTGTDTLPYRIYCSELAKTPKMDTYASIHGLPLVVFLHGAGERGNNNIDQLRLGVSFFLDDSVTDRYSFILLAPQCPADKRWVNTDWTLPCHTMDAEPTAEMRGVFWLIDSLVHSGTADSNRIYICGISMGGFGVWDALQRRPETFAAAIAICGGGDTKQAKRLKTIPIWVFHGKKDKLVQYKRSNDMYGSVKRAGGKNIILTSYANTGHGCWDKAMSTPGLFQWLFSKHNNGKTKTK